MLCLQKLKGLALIFPILQTVVTTLVWWQRSGIEVAATLIQQGSCQLEPGASFHQLEVDLGVGGQLETTLNTTELEQTFGCCAVTFLLVDHHVCQPEADQVILVLDWISSIFIRTYQCDCLSQQASRTLELSSPETAQPRREKLSAQSNLKKRNTSSA